MSVEWESGRRDACLFTGEEGIYNLTMAEDRDLIDYDDKGAAHAPVRNEKQMQREGGERERGIDRWKGGVRLREGWKEGGRVGGWEEQKNRMIRC